jgi:hypothetical protein
MRARNQGGFALRNTATPIDLVLPATSGRTRVCVCVWGWAVRDVREPGWTPPPPPPPSEPQGPLRHDALTGAGAAQDEQAGSLPG